MVFAALVFFVTAGGAYAGKTPPDFAWRKAPGSVALVDGTGEVVWQFNHGESGAIPHFHPVALPGHASLTWHEPPDHVWHYGLWFTWKFINGVNYWEFEKGTRQHQGLTEVRSAEIVTRDDGSARIELALAYRPRNATESVLTENRVIEVSAPTEDGGYTMDWLLAFRAGDEPVELERTPILGQPGGKSWGGYGGLNWRFAESFVDWQVVNEGGDRDRAGHGVASPAIDYSGSLGGVVQGVAMFDHPENFRFPNPWYVGMNSKTPFACLLAAPLFQEGVTLSAGETLTLRYRVIIHPGRWTPEKLREEAARFASSLNR